MKVDNIFDNYSVNKNALSDYGFIKIKDGYCLKKDLENFDFYVKFIIGNNTFDVKVFEANGEEYLPFYIKKARGSYSKKIKEAVKLMINDIICHCFESINIREELLRYLLKIKNKIIIIFLNVLMYPNSLIFQGIRPFLY